MISQNTLKTNAQRYLNLIRSAGIPVPAELADGIRAADWTPDPAVRPDSIRALAAAKTEAEFKVAYAIVAQETAAQLAHESGRMSVVREGYEYSRIMDAVYATADGIFDATIERFNQEAGNFERAAVRIPDLSEIKPIDISEDAVNAITEAKRSAAVLNPLWAVYRQAGRLTDRFTVGERGENPNWADQLNTVFALGDPDDFPQAQQAALLLHDYARNAQGLQLAPLAPTIALTLKGIRIEMVDPEIATDRWEDCTEPRIELAG
ncbi:MAG: hypothetical protein EKK42_15610 [Pseudonocardiaceae bacterium]|nr:MAG: hypothetical protein EKK42_15610 [Pseudonocardiaceae bacterium]